MLQVEQAQICCLPDTFRHQGKVVVWATVLVGSTLGMGSEDMNSRHQGKPLLGKILLPARNGSSPEHPRGNTCSEMGALLELMTSKVLLLDIRRSDNSSGL